MPKEALELLSRVLGCGELPILHQPHILSKQRMNLASFRSTVICCRSRCLRLWLLVEQLPSPEPTRAVPPASQTPGMRPSQKQKNRIASGPNVRLIAKASSRTFVEVQVQAQGTNASPPGGRPCWKSMIYNHQCRQQLRQACWQAA